MQLRRNGAQTPENTRVSRVDAVNLYDSCADPVLLKNNTQAPAVLAGFGYFAASLSAACAAARRAIGTR
jgi:hypothetical protein